MKKLIAFITGEIRNILDSFKNNAHGYSGRKLSSFAGVSMGAYITVYRLPDDATIRLYVMCVWLLFSLLCLGIVTVQQVIEFKNGRKEQQPAVEQPA